MAFEIPKEDVAAIATLKAMPASAVEELIKSIKSAPLTTDTDEMASRIAEKIPSASARQLEAILDALYGLYYIRELSGVRRATFLDDLMDGIRANPELTVDDNGAQKLRARFEKLLSIDTFNILSKGKRLQRDGERLYCDAKMISDIRPVFGSKPAKPLGGVITHTLKLGYHEGGQHREFHVVLDAIDLDMLTRVLARAQEKNVALRKLLKEIELPDIGV